MKQTFYELTGAHGNVLINMVAQNFLHYYELTGAHGNVLIHMVVQNFLHYYELTEMC
jgi:hypothetical protein